MDDVKNRYHKLRTGLPQDAIVQFAHLDCKQSSSPDMMEVRSGVSGMDADHSTDWWRRG